MRYQECDQGMGVVRIGSGGGGFRIGGSGHVGNQSVARIFVGGNRWPYRQYYPTYYPYAYSYPTCATPCAPLNIGGYGCYNAWGQLSACRPQAVVPVTVIGY